MLHLGKDIKLNIKPVYVTLHHDYVFEGPCRMGKDFELTREFDDMANQELLRGSNEELAENLSSPHFNVMEPVWSDRNEEFLVTPDILDELLKDKDQVDVYLVAPHGQLTADGIPLSGLSVPGLAPGAGRKRPVPYRRRQRHAAHPGRSGIVPGTSGGAACGGRAGSRF